MNKIPGDELKEVSGGTGYKDLGNGDVKAWIICQSCRGYREDLGTMNKSMNVEITGTFVCPNCGWTTNYTFYCNEVNGAYFRLYR